MAQQTTKRKSKTGVERKANRMQATLRTWASLKQPLEPRQARNKFPAQARKMRPVRDSYDPTTCCGTLMHAVSLRSNPIKIFASATRRPISTTHSFHSLARALFPSWSAHPRTDPAHDVAHPCRLPYAPRLKSGSTPPPLPLHPYALLSCI